MTTPPRKTRSRSLATLLVLMVLAVAGCTRPQESAGGNAGPLDKSAPRVEVAEHQAWTRAPSGSGALKIVVLNVTATGATTMRWQDLRLVTATGNLTPSSAYVRLPNGTSFGWTADRTLAANESFSAEWHFRANETTEEPTLAFLAGPGWTANVTLPPPSRASV